jgi:hypothetical protein
MHWSEFANSYDRMFATKNFRINSKTKMSRKTDHDEPSKRSEIVAFHQLSTNTIEIYWMTLTSGHMIESCDGVKIEEWLTFLRTYQIGSAFHLSRVLHGQTMLWMITTWRWRWMESNWSQSWSFQRRENDALYSLVKWEGCSLRKDPTLENSASTMVSCLGWLREVIKGGNVDISPSFSDQWNLWRCDFSGSRFFSFYLNE